MKERLPKIDVKPEIPKKRKLKDMQEYLLSNAEQYDIVFWIVDLDAILHNDQIEQFTEVLRQLKKTDNIRILINNPCLEFWLLLHFKETSKTYSKCDDAVKQLRKCPLLKDYEKTEKYYKSNNDIYMKLQSFQCTAINNAEKLGEFSIAEPFVAKAEMYQIFHKVLK